MKLLSKSLLVTSVAAIGFSVAYGQSSRESGYMTDPSGDVVRSGGNLCWRTGSWTPAMATAECDPDLVPAPVAVLTPQAPAAAPAPAPKPAAEKVSLSADTLFEFDKAVLRSEGRSKIDELVESSKDINLEVITAVGFADRIGTESYNQQLSERRAEAVKSYLVSKGVDANRVYSEGKGEAQPVTEGQCTDMGRDSGDNRALVDCLQPNRRVELEVIGTR